MNWLPIIYTLLLFLIGLYLAIKLNKKIIVIIILTLFIVYSYEVFTIHRSSVISQVFLSNQVEVTSLNNEKNFLVDSSSLLEDTDSLLGRKKPNVKSMTSSYKLAFHNDDQKLLTAYILTINKKDELDNEFQMYDYEEFQEGYAILRFRGRYYHMGQDFYTNLEKVLKSSLFNRRELF
ncbi:hypothetical protein [Alkaliphilus transvaalensis]|uniref:hypothetical protein n=1 Tax=Alkaliphilus transvaalensis TaxID=114628 RepID=UPI00047D545D|nr:hypothetical protein [Alkaliphilus transvaalensis]